MPHRDPEAQRDRNRRYYLLHKDQIKERATRWAINNRERRRQIARESRQRNYDPTNEVEREASNVRAKAWSKANPEKTRARNQAWRALNPEKNSLNQKKYRERNPDKMHTFKQRRRAREQGAFIEDVDRQIVYDRGQGICGICHKPVDHKRFDVDHIVPLSKGGLHCYSNTQPAHPRCNSRKNNRLPQSVTSSTL